MQKLISFVLGAFLMVSTFNVMAIDPPTKTKASAMESFGYEISSATFQDAVFQSDDNQQVFIDFDDIPVNLKCIQIMDSDGKELFKQSVYKLSVSSLLEIDLSAFQQNGLVLEIQTFTDSRFIQLGDMK